MGVPFDDSKDRLVLESAQEQVIDESDNVVKLGARDDSVRCAVDLNHPSASGHDVCFRQRRQPADLGGFATNVPAPRAPQTGDCTANQSALVRQQRDLEQHDFYTPTKMPQASVARAE